MGGMPNQGDSTNPSEMDVNQMGGMMPQMMGNMNMNMDPSAANNMGMSVNPQDMSSMGMGMNLFNGMYPGMMPPFQNQGGQNVPNPMNPGEKNNNNDIDNDDEQ